MPFCADILLTGMGPRTLHETVVLERLEPCRMDSGDSAVLPGKFTERTPTYRERSQRNPEGPIRQALP